MRLLNKFGVVVLGLSVTGVAGAAAGYWSGSGPFGGTIYDVMVDPATPSVVYASTRGGLYRSDDAGSNWQRKDDGIAAGTSYGMVLATDPDLAGRLLAVDWTFRVFRSADRGDNWTFTGFVPPAGVSVVAVADVPGVAGSFYVLTSPVGVYKTTDNGSSFSEVVTGIPAGATASFIRTDHDTPNLVFVGISDFYGSTNPAATTWIWRSLDSGVTWSASYDTAGQPTYPTFVEDLSFGAGNTLYATANSQLIRSTDNGASWELRGSAGNVVKAHPTIADTVFVAKGYSGGAVGNFHQHGWWHDVFDDKHWSANTSYGGEAFNRIALHPNFRDAETLPRQWCGGHFLQQQWRDQLCASQCRHRSSQCARLGGIARSWEIACWQRRCIHAIARHFQQCQCRAYLGHGERWFARLQHPCNHGRPDNRPCTKCDDRLRRWAERHREYRRSTQRRFVQE